MGRMIYKKPEASNIRGICVVCGVNPQKTKADGKYKALCSGCDRRRYITEEGQKVRRATIARSKDSIKRPYRKYVKLKCETCPFIAEDVCQMDVDHIDGNHQNNEPSNLQVLCACCHRLKTKRNEDWRQQ